MLLLGVCGCASASWRAVRTSSDEWLLYRKTRIAPSFEGRVIAAARYLARYPRGEFAAQTKSFYGVAEALYFDDLRQKPDGLYTYLAALPRGPHADEARQTLYRLSQKPRGPTGFDGGIMAVDAQIAAVAGRRTASREEMLKALRLWLDREAFAHPIAEAKATLIIPWSLSLPIARCNRVEEPGVTVVRTCSKLLEETYEVTNGNALEEHQLTFEVTVSQDATGRPTKVVLGGPDLFVRLEETFGGHTIRSDDTSGRAAGVSRATDVVRREFAAHVSDDVACRKRAQGGAVMELQCSGLHLAVEAALDAANDDRIVIEPAAEP